MVSAVQLDDRDPKLLAERMVLLLRSFTDHQNSLDRNRTRSVSFAMRYIIPTLIVIFSVPAIAQSSLESTHYASEVVNGLRWDIDLQTEFGTADSVIVTACLQNVSGAI